MEGLKGKVFIVTGAGLMIRESLRALTRRTTQAWGQKNIRANAVAHGVVLAQKFPCRPCASGLPCGCCRVTQRFGRGTVFAIHEGV